MPNKKHSQITGIYTAIHATKERYIREHVFCIGILLAGCCASIPQYVELCRSISGEGGLLRDFDSIYYYIPTIDVIGCYMH